jgi:hypothetical protein
MPGQFPLKQPSLDELGFAEKYQEVQAQMNHAL